jgi:hypothetical protein
MLDWFLAVNRVGTWNQHTTAGSADLLIQNNPVGEIVAFA